MQKIIRIFTYFTASLLLLGSCEESKRFEISGNDSTPPGTPVFDGFEPLPGGAKVFFIPPADQDVLYIEASYVNVVGKRLRFAASFAAGQVDVSGFGREGEHIIELCAVDCAGNRSTSVFATVEALEPPAVMLAKSVDVLSSFSSMLVKWTNELKEPLYVWVDLSYAKNGVRQNHTTVFNTYLTETRSVDSLKLYNDEPVMVKVSISDMYDNTVQAKDTTIVLLVDGVIPKGGWSLIPAGAVMGGITQVSGLRRETVIDGVIDVDEENFFVTTQNNPWNMIIDLGEEFEISRIVTHQRWTGYNIDGNPDIRGNLYRGDNVLTSQLYGWDETAQSWDFLSRRVIIPPVVKTNDDYLILGKAGDMAFIYPAEPQFSKPTRFVRFEAINGKYISEITLYGRRAQ